MKKIYFILPVALFVIWILSCNSDKQDATKIASASFDMKQARAFIDSINAKWEIELKNGDSASIDSHYGPDAKILVSGSDAITGSDIPAAWGSMIRAGLRDWKFVTTDLVGNSDFLIETGKYEITGSDKKVAGKGNYVVVWKAQPDGTWKMYRDVGVSSMPTPSK